MAKKKVEPQVCAIDAVKLQAEVENLKAVQSENEGLLRRQAEEIERLLPLVTAGAGIPTTEVRRKAREQVTLFIDYGKAQGFAPPPELQQVLAWLAQ